MPSLTDTLRDLSEPSTEKSHKSLEEKIMGFLTGLSVDELVAATLLALMVTNIGLTISLNKKVDDMSGSLNQDVSDLTAATNQLIAGQQTEMTSIEDAANEIHTLLSQNQVDPAVRTALQAATQKILGAVATVNDNNVKLQSAMSEVANPPPPPPPPPDGGGGTTTPPDGGGGTTTPPDGTPTDPATGRRRS